MPGDLIPFHYDLEFRPEFNDETGRGLVCDSKVEVHNYIIHTETYENENETAISQTWEQASTSIKILIYYDEVLLGRYKKTNNTRVH